MSKAKEIIEKYKLEEIKKEKIKPGDPEDIGQIFTLSRTYNNIIQTHLKSINKKIGQIEFKNVLTQKGNETFIKLVDEVEKALKKLNLFLP